MKRVLIISPYFPPFNAADMQRVRMSLPFFKEFGWEAEVVAVHPRYVDVSKDELLLQSLPAGLPVHYVDALPKRWTSKLGLGSIALRSLPYYRSTISRLLASKRFDLVYFSTTQFPVCVLGRYWKKKFGVPYLIDMQDPWRSDYYLKKPKHERPAKFWFSYRLDKWLERVAMQKVDGLVAVSQAYLDTLAQRYSNCSQIPRRTITFGSFDTDFMIALRNVALQPSAIPSSAKKSIVYVGRGGKDMQPALRLLFTAFRQGLDENPSLYNQLAFSFFGTSYAVKGQGVVTVMPVARNLGVEGFVTENTDRLPFYQTLNTLAAADALFIPGSNDSQYTASKIYPYVGVQKPLLALFHPASSVVSFLKAAGVGYVLSFDQEQQEIIHQIKNFLLQVASGTAPAEQPDSEVMQQFSAREMTRRQCELFNEIVG